jgi:hypothetical protein
MARDSNGAREQIASLDKSAFEGDWTPGRPRQERSLGLTEFLVELRDADAVSLLTESALESGSVNRRLNALCTEASAPS